MAESESPNLPDPGDNQTGRQAAMESFMGAALNLPFTAYDAVLRNAAEHAADPARADPLNLPWISRGPRNLGGRISTLAQEPGNPRVLYAGSAHGGLWKTVNAGDTWQPLNGFVEGTAAKDIAVPIGAIGICHRQSQTVWVGTGEPSGATHQGFGLFRSDDGGATFARVDPAPGSPAPAATIPGNAFHRIFVDPWDAGRVWLATPQGLWDIDPTRPAASRIQEVTFDIGALPATGQPITDIAIDFGNKASAAPPGTYTIYVGLTDTTDGSPHLLKAAWNPATQAYVAVAGQIWTDTNIHTQANLVPAAPAGGSHNLLGRVRVALCENNPQHVYAIIATHRFDPAATPRDTFPPSRVLYSSDATVNWSAPSATPAGENVSWYAMCLEVHPNNPRIAVFGCMDLHRTTNAAGAWTKIIDWTQYRQGDRAQHADQHAVLIDRGNTQHLWVGNDGGVSHSVNLGTNWTKPSHGIVAAQFYEFAVHPTWPFIMGGGLQDNGSWIGFGGDSWFQTGIADGGGMAFQPGRADVLATCNQSIPTNVQLRTQHFPSLQPAAIGALGGGNFDIGVHLPDQPLGVGGTFPFFVANITGMLQAAGTVNGTIFGRPMEGHPTRADRLVIGWTGQLRNQAGGSLNTNPPDFWHKNIGGGLALAGAVSAISFDPSSPNTIWVGSTQGELFFTTNIGGAWTNVTPQLAIGATEITGIAVHPANNAVVAISTAATAGNVIMSVNARARTAGAASSTWRVISNVSGTPAAPSPANRDLPLSPVAQVAFDSQVTPPVGGARQTYTLFAATLGGVYVTHQADSHAAATPNWFTMNRNMPVVLVRDLDVVDLINNAGDTTRRILRAATFGRGIYECDLNGTQNARVYIRQRAIDDGRTYRGTQVMTTDPRLNTPPNAPAAFDLRRAIDIRIDAPPYSTASGVVVDGVDFDEHLRADDLRLGETNFLYIQLHTRGHERLGTASGNATTGADARPRVHVYYADAVAPLVAGQPHTAPDLQAGFWTDFPTAPPPTATWRKAGEAEVFDLAADNPRVARLEWGPPTDLSAQVAILAVVDHPMNDVAGDAATLPLAVDPDRADPLIPDTHRAALFITPTSTGGTEDVAIRDGQDDTGALGEIAWGGRTADIIVVQATPGDPAAEFADITDLRHADRVRGGVDNHIYVRVHNLGDATQDINVDLFAVPHDKIAVPGDWVQIATQQTAQDVPAHGFGLSPVFTWASADVPDPVPGSTVKSQILVALISTANDPVPDHTTITSLAGFWDFFLSGDHANKAAMRALIFEP